jgi:protein gp37
VAENSRIGWTDHTFNPWTGCLKVSKGCKHCYAEAWAKRVGRDLFGALDKRTRTTKSIWAKPRTWNHVASLDRRPRKVFCASLADLFEDAPGPNEWRADVWDLIRACPWLDWQLLTKRPENIARMLPEDWGRGWPNVWLGTSIEDRDVVDRARVLGEVPAYRRFISYEPALGPVIPEEIRAVSGAEDPAENGTFYRWADDYTGPGLGFYNRDGDLAFHWLICGGESGAGFRPMDLEWAADARDACDTEGVAFYFKQISHFRNEQGDDALGEVLHGFPTSWDRADLDTHPIFAPEGSLLR